MKLSDIKDPDGFYDRFLAPNLIGMGFLVETLERYQILMKHLNNNGWVWRNYYKLDDWIPVWVGSSSGYICLEKCYNRVTTYVRSCLDNPNLYRSGYQVLELEWDDVSKEQIGGTFCSCATPKLRKVYAGLGAGANTFNFCDLCKKERQ
jgi:hypothetical protein